MMKNIELLLRKFFGRIKMVFGENLSATLEILTIRWILEKGRAKNFEVTLLKKFSKAFDSIQRGKMEQILLTHGLPQNPSLQ